MGIFEKGFETPSPIQEEAIPIILQVREGGSGGAGREKRRGGRRGSKGVEGGAFTQGPSR
jgi:hypothetical protein